MAHIKKDPDGLRMAYIELVTTGCQVLSPHLLTFNSEEFAKTVAEVAMSPKQIEEYHLLCIRQADFLWVHAPAGYIGLSGSFEIGYAIAHNVPIYCNLPPEDILLKEFVTIVPSVFKARQLVEKYSATV